MAETKRDAEHQFDWRPPILTAFLAVLIPIAYGALWLSTRGQHPYSGPSGGAIVLTYVVVVVASAAAVKFPRRATSGVSGASIRQQRIEGAALGVSILGSPMIQGALYHYHASHAIVYGVIPAAGPLIIIGTTFMGIAGLNADWPGFWAALAAVIAGMVTLFVGPSRAWLAAGIGMFIVIVGFTVAQRICVHGRRSHGHRHPRPGNPRPGEAADRRDAGRTTRPGHTLVHPPARHARSHPGRLITRLRKLEDAGYLTTEMTGNGRASRTSIALTHQRRAALDTYTDALRDLLDGL